MLASYGLIYNLMKKKTSISPKVLGLFDHMALDVLRVKRFWVN